MKLIILPGNSKSNREWNQKASEVLKSYFPERYIQDYSHWDSDTDILDFEVEAKKLSDNIGTEECMIFAKSAGSLLAAYCISKNLIKPKKSVFLGLPVLWAKEHGFEIDKWFQGYEVPTVILQNANDPIASFDVMKSFIDTLDIKQSIDLIKLDGDDHKYDDFQLIEKKISGFFL